MIMCMALVAAGGGAESGSDAPALPQGRIKSIFGLKRADPPFAGKDETAVAETLKGMGVNAVFGVQEDRALCKALQKAGIRVYVEVGIFEGAKRWEQHPELRPITAEGKPMERDRWYGGACPNQEWLRKEKLELLRKFVGEYEADGVWLDFIRYSGHWEVKEPRLEQNCFCPVCLKLFQDRTKLDFPPELADAKAKAGWILSRHKDKWTEFKCERISAFVGECRAVVKKVNPKAVVGLFGVPWLESDYRNAIKEIIAQDYAALGKRVDIFSPMCYHAMCGRDVNWISTVSAEISRLSGKPCAPIVQAAEIPPDEFGAALEAAIAGPSRGVIVFNWRHLKKADNLEKFRALRAD